MKQIKHSLPKFNDRRTARCELLARQVAERGVANGSVMAVVVAEDLDAMFCVPRVVAGGPGQRSVEGLYEVIETPGQDHDVVRVTEEHNHHGRETKSWKKSFAMHLTSMMRCITKGFDCKI